MQVWFVLWGVNLSFDSDIPSQSCLGFNDWIGLGIDKPESQLPIKLQLELKVPKSQTGKFGQFRLWGQTHSQTSNTYYF